MNRVIGFSINKPDEEVFEGTKVALGCHEEIRVSSNRAKEWQSEIIFAYLEGRVGDYVNVEAFAVKCDENQLYTKISRENNFIDSSELTKGFRGVTDSSIYSGSRRNEKNNVDCYIEKLAQEEERPARRAEFEEFYEVLAIEQGINLRSLISKALTTGLRSFINRIRHYMEVYGKEELIEAVLKDEILLRDVLELKEDEEISTIPCFGGYQS